VVAIFALFSNPLFTINVHVCQKLLYRSCHTSLTTNALYLLGRDKCVFYVLIIVGYRIVVVLIIIIALSPVMRDNRAQTILLFHMIKDTAISKTSVTVFSLSLILMNVTYHRLLFLLSVMLS